LNMMEETGAHLFGKKTAGLFLGVSAGMNVLLWGLVSFVFPKDQPAAILHYSVDMGIDFVGQGSQIIMLPLMGTLLLVVNIVLGLAVWQADKRAAWVLWSVLPFWQVILLGVFYLLWRVNG